MPVADAPWVIIGCGKSKRTKPTPAADLYTGAYITCAVRWARSVTIPNRLLIMSAKHGLIRGTRLIAPYNASFSTGGYAASPGSEPPVGNDVLATQIAEFGLSGPVITLAGSSYQQRLIAASGGRLVPINPFFAVLDQLGVNRRHGYQAQQFKRWYGRVPPLNPKETP